MNVGGFSANVCRSFDNQHGHAKQPRAPACCQPVSHPAGLLHCDGRRAGKAVESAGAGDAGGGGRGARHAAGLANVQRRSVRAQLPAACSAGHTSWGTVPGADPLPASSAPQTRSSTPVASQLAGCDLRPAACATWRGGGGGERWPHRPELKSSGRWVPELQELALTPPAPGPRPPGS